MQEKDDSNLLSLKTLPLSLVVPSLNQPRRSDSFDEKTLVELAQSIQSVGLLQPPLVRPLSNGRFEIVAGERRVRAAKLAGLKEIPVYIQEQDDLKKGLSALIENLQRENLNPIDTALALKELTEEFQLTHQKIAEMLGLNRASLSNLIRLLNLSPHIQQALKKQQITQGHAKALLSLDSLDKREALLHRILRDDLSVRETERFAKQMNSLHALSSKQKMKPSILLKQIQESLQERMGTKVSFQGSDKMGTLCFHYYSLSDLNRLLNALGYTES